MATNEHKGNAILLAAVVKARGYVAVAVAAAVAATLGILRAIADIYPLTKTPRPARGVSEA